VSTDRFHDPDLPLEAYLDEVLVECPRCGACAHIVPVDAAAPWPERGDWRRDRRLTCAECTLVRTWPAPGDTRTARTGTDVDPWFHLPLWLRTDACGHVLWAYNERHLDLLRGFVAARHRTRDATPTRIHSVASRLPGWLKDAKHRDDLLRALDRLTSRARAHRST
jgi:hypothetical protein